jgi:hypothetical protein
MKKTTIILVAFIAFVFVACSKKDSGGSPANKGTIVSVQNTTSFELDIDTLYIEAYKDTSYAQFSQDTASDKSEIITMSPLPMGQTSAPVTIAPLYKCYFIVYKHYNTVLKQWLESKVTRLSDGTSADPYLIKPGETKVIVLDANTQTEFL